MNLFLKRFLLFSLFLLIVYLLFVYIYGSLTPERWRPNMPNRLGGYGHLNSRINEIHKFKDIDILFIGSSHAYRGFDVRIFNQYGYKVFNLGSSAQTPIQSYILLKKNIDSLNPKLVVYEVYPETFCIDGVESALDLVSNMRNNFLTFKMVLTLNNLKLYNTYFFSLFNDICHNKEKYSEPIRKKNDTYIPGGYVQKDFMQLQTIDSLASLKMNDLQVNYFKKITKYLKNKKINYLLVQAPVTKSKSKSFDSFNEYNQLMNNYPNYINFNHLVKLNDKFHFYDSNHLNQDGVIIFNNFFINNLNLNSKIK
jgi:hypothetical protein